VSVRGIRHQRDRVRFLPARDPNAGPRWFFTNLAQVKLTREASRGQLAIVELSGPTGDMPPLHLHRTDDEAWFVLEGELSFFVGRNEPVRVTAGGLAFGPKGVAHTYRVESSQPARWLAVCTPGDFAAFVLAASRPAERPGLPPPPEPPSDDEVAEVLPDQRRLVLAGSVRPLPSS
jgi:mannose-6-phosphate isomerase-like protein (cupin superfamily)